MYQYFFKYFFHTNIFQCKIQYIHYIVDT